VNRLETREGNTLSSRGIKSDSSGAREMPLLPKIFLFDLALRFVEVIMRNPILSALFSAKVPVNVATSLSRREGKHKVSAIVAMVCLHFCFLFSAAVAQNDVLTHHNDVARTGQNLNETLLTPANVNASQFGKLFTRSVDGILVGQPLYASNVLMVDGLVHNVVFVATQHNTVYAFDADSNLGNNAVPIWAVSMNDGGTPDPISDYGCKGTGFSEIGVTGTPVIDAAKTTLYVVAKTLTPDGNRHYALHALNLANGSEMLGGPAQITGSNGSDTFLVQYQLQRPALLLENGSIYIGFGGNGCDIYNYNGWLFAYDAQTLQQQGLFEVSPNGRQSAIWLGGAGPSADEFGNIYTVTGNGTYDGPQAGNDYGDSLLKMGWTGNSFGIFDYFTPFNQEDLYIHDGDLGSAGALILPDQPGLYPHELVAGGKGGTLYLLNRDNLGQYNPGYDNVIQEFVDETSFQLTGSPSYWNGSVYVAGDRDYIKQYGLVNGLLTSTPLSQSTVLFTGKGVASTSLTANGTKNAILWALNHSSYVLYAFDPTNLANIFYTSRQALHGRDQMSAMVRYATPTISNGKVFIPGKTELSVFGLLPVLSPASGNNQSGTKQEVLPIPLVVLASDAYSQAPLAGLAITCNDGKANGVLLPSATQTTDATGKATFEYQLPTSTQVVTIVCTSPTTTTTSFTETCTAGAPAAIKVVSGNRQSAPPNTMLAKPFVVKVVDATGIGVPGVTVNFTDNAAGGSFSSTAPVTNSKGEATTQYTTGPTAGKVTVTSSTAGVSPKNLLVTVE
jgi:hypothetical protein